MRNQIHIYISLSLYLSLSLSLTHTHTKNTFSAFRGIKKINVFLQSVTNSNYFTNSPLGLKLTQTRNIEFISIEIIFRRGE
jgi:hypothetical protein